MTWGEGGAGTFAAVMLAALMACAITSTGIWLVSRYEERVEQNTVYFVSFAAGVLLSVSLVHVAPHSWRMNDTAPLFLLAGFLGLYLTNRFLHLSAFQESDEGQGGPSLRSLVPILGVGFHSFVDGVIYSITFGAGIFTGALTALGMVLHEIPEGIIAFVLLQQGGYGRRKSMFYAFLVAALSTPLGALVSYPLLQQVGEPALGNLLGLSAGALIYVGASHLLPAAERESRRYTTLVMIAGVVVGLLIIATRASMF